MLFNFTIKTIRNRTNLKNECMTRICGFHEDDGDKRNEWSRQMTWLKLTHVTETKKQRVKLLWRVSFNKRVLPDWNRQVSQSFLFARWCLFFFWSNFFDQSPVMSFIIILLSRFRLIIYIYIYVVDSVILLFRYEH